MQTPTIVALATPLGRSAIAIIRISGPQAIEIVQAVFQGKKLALQPSHTIHFGKIHHQGQTIDEVLVSLFKAPHSFTKEDTIEISCHGNPLTIQQIIQLLLQKGAQPAKPGEFTQRAFLNGRFDLTQAEAIAELIAANTIAAQKAALQQMRGQLSQTIQDLRQKLIHYTSMLELTLDFSEEDIQPIDQQEQKNTLQKLLDEIQSLIDKFQQGNAIKSGVLTIITGQPNVGKSTLLNALTGEEKSIVSNLPGTTRDIIEDQIVLEGIDFRLVDTAGLRTPKNKIEAIGITKAQEKLKKASLILQIFDLTQETPTSIATQLQALQKKKIPYIAIGNKIDKAPSSLQENCKTLNITMISAKNQKNLEQLKKQIVTTTINNTNNTEQSISLNSRHYHNLTNTKKALEQALHSIKQQLGSELVLIDIREALHQLGEITGEITTEDLLSNIFSKFCIGK